MAFQDKVAECVVYLLMLNLIKFKYCLPTSAQQILYWFCSGDYSTLTYNDCQGNYYNTTGCYFIENFSQYRPCSAICNDVAYNSINEEKCRAYCDDYFVSACKLSNPSPTPVEESSSLQSNTTDYGQIGRTSKFTTVAVITGTFTIIILAITVIAVVWLGSRRTTLTKCCLCKHNPGDKDLPRATFHNENSNRIVDDEVCHLTDVTYATDQNEKNLLWEEESEHKTCSH